MSDSNMMILDIGYEANKVPIYLCFINHQHFRVTWWENNSQLHHIKNKSMQVFCLFGHFIWAISYRLGVDVMSVHERLSTTQHSQPGLVGSGLTHHTETTAFKSSAISQVDHYCTTSTYDILIRQGRGKSRLQFIDLYVYIAYISMDDKAHL